MSSEGCKNVFNVCSSSSCSYTVSFQVFGSYPKQVTLLVQEVTCDLSVLPLTTKTTVVTFPPFTQFSHERFVLLVCEKGEPPLHKRQVL